MHNQTEEKLYCPQCGSDQLAPYGGAEEQLQNTFMCLHCTHIGAWAEARTRPARLMPRHELTLLQTTGVLCNEYTPLLIWGILAIGLLTILLGGGYCVLMKSRTKAQRVDKC